MKKLVAAIACLFISSQAFAYGTVGNAKVLEVRMDQSGKGMVIFDQLIAGDKATCVHPSYTNALAFDLNTAGGKGILAVALAAKAAGTTMNVYGTATCSIYGGHVEDWMYGTSK